MQHLLVNDHNSLDVFFFEAFEEECRQLKHEIPGSLRAGYTGKTIQELCADTPPAPVISIRTQSVIPVSWAKSLTAVITRSTGYDHISTWLTRARSHIPCGFLPLYCNRSVAEQAALLWLALLRKLPMQCNQFTSFKRDGITGTECYGKTLTVVGAGNIGCELVKIGAGLGMTVLAVDIVERHPGLTYVSQDKGLAAADVVVCAMNLTPQNIGYFNAKTLAVMKPGALFINIARGEMSPPEDLLAMLKNGHLGGVGLDVYSHEPELAILLRNGLQTDTPEFNALQALSERHDVILTPHNAFNTHEAVTRKARQTIEQLLAFQSHGSFTWPVPAVSIKKSEN
jgi:D-lactate dehydrogenase